MKFTAPQPPPGYEICRLLGDGANGLVYLARDLQQDREVALKEFRIGALSAQRFFRELSLLFTLEHPHLIRCLNLVYGREGSNFLVLEYAAGGSLRGRLSRIGKLSEAEVHILAYQMAGALECAHRHDVIHCDVKPENILLAEESEPLHYKLTDLGIAYHRLRDPVPELGGSPRYMAPELFYDRPVPASDFYSLGIVLFECLTGEAPFVGNNEYLFNAHTREAPDLERVQSPAWRYLLAMMLDKDPARRPLTWAAMQRWLENGKGHVRVDQAAAPASTETSPGMDHFLKGKLMALGEARLAPGARDLWLPFGSTQTRVWVPDQRSVDWFDAETGKFRPRERIGRFQVGANAVRGDASAAVLSNELHVFPDAEGKAELYSVPPGLCSLIQLPGGGFWAADGRQVFRLDAEGRVEWTAACASYVFPTVIAASEQGDLLAARGPVMPTLMRWSVDGAEHVKVEAPQPVLAAGFDPIDHQVLCVVQGAEPDQPCRLMTWRSRALEEVTPLVEGVFAARWIQGCFVLMTTDRHLVVMDRTGNERGRMELAGSPMQVVWVPRLCGFVALSKKGDTGVLQRFQFKPTCDGVAPQGVHYVHHV